MSDKIKILLLAADPRDVNYRTLWAQEVNHIKEAIELTTHRDLFEVNAEFGVKPKNLQEKLMKYQPNIVHFSGHANKEYGLLLEDDFADSDTVEADVLASVINVFKDYIRLVLLNACHTTVMVEAFKEAIDFTIGMNSSVHDRSAIAFAGAFYRGLAYGYTVKMAFDMAVNQIKLENLPGPDTPALFTRKGVDPWKPFIEPNSHSTLEQEKQVVVEKPGACLWIHGWVMRVYDVLPTVELDWTRYFDRSSRTVPSQEVWEKSLLPLLAEAKVRLREYGSFIDIRGRLSLTAMLAVGSLFPQVDGYRLRAEQPTLGKTTLWRSDVEPSKCRFRIIEEKQKRIGERSDDILIALSITGNASREVTSLYKQDEQISAMILAEPDTGTGEGALGSDSDAVALAANAKELIRKLQIKYEACRTHLVLYTPASYSLFLGQYLNALGDIITYERDMDGNYRRSIILRTG